MPFHFAQQFLDNNNFVIESGTTMKIKFINFALVTATANLDSESQRNQL